MRKIKLNSDDLLKNLILLFTVTLLCFFILESGVRIVGDYDIDGQFYFMKRSILPYALPYNSVLKEINEFEELDNPYIIPDPLLGWTINNNSISSDGLRKSNSIGIRSDREFNLTKSPKIMRIALFGDSMVYSDEVPFKQSWAYYLEKEFSDNNIIVEVMNFGTGGYGNDQAYLRWKTQGIRYNPDIVIIGFQAENCKRNLNIIRKFYNRGTGIPFSKPRFVLQNDNLTLVNYPTVDYTDIPDLVKGFDDSELKNFEYYYKPYQSDNPVYLSKAASTFLTFLYIIRNRKSDSNFYKGGSEESELCYQILNKFIVEASENSSVFIVNLPWDLDYDKLTGSPSIYEPLLLRIDENFKLINPSDALIQEARITNLSSLFAGGHYSGKSNKIVAYSIYTVLGNENLTGEHDDE